MFQQPLLQQIDGLLRVAPGGQYPRVQHQCCRLLCGLGMALEYGQRAVVVAALLQQQGLGKHQLGVIRVVFKQLAHAFQHGFTGGVIGLGGGQGEEVEVRLAMHAQNLLHCLHGPLMLPGSGQVQGSSAKGFRIVGIDLGPEHGHFQGGLMRAEKFRDAHSAFDHAGIARPPGLDQVVVQRNIVAVTLAGDLCGQQVEQRVAGKLAVDNGRFDRGLLCCGGGDHRGGRSGWLGRCAAAEYQGQGYQAR